jgi:hypothetical protein
MRTGQGVDALPDTGRKLNCARVIQECSPLARTLVATVRQNHGLGGYQDIVLRFDKDGNNPKT